MSSSLFVEIGITAYLASLIGSKVTFSIYAVPTVIGLFYAWKLYPEIKKLMVLIKATDTGLVDSENIYTPENRERIIVISEVFLYWISIVLILISRIITGTIGFTVLIPTSRQKIISFSLIKFGFPRHETDIQS